MATVDHERLERLLSALHHTNSGVSVLRRLCLVCVDHIGADGASVTRFGPGPPRVMEYSDAEFLGVARLQVEMNDGPCFAAIETMSAVAEPDFASVEAVSAWPRFAPAAKSHGVMAAFAFPLVHEAHATGTLDVYNRTAGPLTADGAADASMVADLATLAIAQSHRHGEIGDVGISVEPDAPWAHSAPVHNACGMLSEQLGITVDEALLRLRALAFVDGRTVITLARAVVNRELRLQPWSWDD